jgi:hypothetical protein
MIILRHPCADVIPLPALPPSQAKKPRPKPERTIRLTHPVEGGYRGHVIITVGDESADYELQRFESPLGDAFRMTKVFPDPDAEEFVYHVLLADDGCSSSCECLGFCRYGRCKHVEGLIALKAAGKL